MDFLEHGGGMILVPALTSIIKLDEVKSRATAITGILFMVITSSFFYFKSDYIDLNLRLKCAIGGIIGGIIGSKLLLTSFRIPNISIIL